MQGFSSRSCACMVSSLLVLASTTHATSTLTLPSKASATAASAMQAGFTLDGVKTLTLMFRIKPLPQPPTPPAAYKGFPMWRWEWLGGDGYLLVTRNDLGPIGVLSEMMYFPGRFRPKCSNDDKFFSAQRFWVDMQISQQIGRTYWGFPKELASFQWTSDSVTAKDLNGKVFFNATLEAATASAEMPAWIKSYVKNGFNTLQWPIKDARIDIANLIKVDMNVVTTAEERAQATEEAAVAASLLHGSEAAQLDAAIVAATMKGPATLVPNRQILDFPKYDALVLTRATSVWFNSSMFTGRVNMSVSLAGSGEVASVNGSPGELDDPQMYTCKKQTQADTVNEAAQGE